MPTRTLEFAMTDSTGNLTLTELDQVSAGLRPLELAAKLERLRELLVARGLTALLLRRHENLAWLTAGQVEARVGVRSETAVASLLLLRDGQRFYLAPNNEAPRLAAEEFTALGYEPVLHPWWSDSSATLAKLVGDGLLGTDSPGPFSGAAAVNLGPLRAPLTEPEILRYRWLGAQTADVVQAAILTLEPGISEFEMESRVAGALLARGILPSVLLMAVDERILRYKHAVARGARLDRFGMVNLCTRKWGLAISITRFVHFGPLPESLAAGFHIAAQVNAALLGASRPGASAAELYAAARSAYAEAGAPGEEENHHQGGPAGYLEREWLAAPGGAQQLSTVQALAWNPSARGGKVEDTTLMTESGLEILTRTPSLPEVQTTRNGTTYSSAGVLVR
jgi:antitoxin VapB